jgi:hypothetical protein
MALALTHPDYASDRRITLAYDRFLGHFRDDRSAWRPLPAELADWWVRRSRSTVRCRPEVGWTIEGPAARDGRIRLSRRLEESAPQRGSVRSGFGADR